MSDPESSESLVYLAELEGLGAAHLVGEALNEASIPFKVAVNSASGFDVVIPRSWGMLYVDGSRMDEAVAVLEQVRSDQFQASEDYDPEAEVTLPPESEFVQE